MHFKLRCPHCRESFTAIKQINVSFEEKTQYVADPKTQAQAQFENERASRAALRRLTPYRKRIAAMAIGGMRTAEIATALNVSHGAVRVALWRIYEQLDVADLTDLVRWSSEHPVFLEALAEERASRAAPPRHGWAAHAKKSS